MSLFRAVARSATISRQVVPRTSLPQIASVQSLRFNSSGVQKDTKETPASLTAQIFRSDKEKITEDDLDEWLSAVRVLKEGEQKPETETELYIQEFLKPEQFLRDTFEPTEAQLAEVEQFKSSPVPLKAEPLVEHFVNVLMKNGKKSKARTIFSRALYLVGLRTGLDPLKVLYDALERLGPLFNTRTVRTGFAKNITLPVALNKRQRNRYAIDWILEGTNNKKSSAMSVRLAEEIINAYEGRSSGYDKKARMHKDATTQRAYLKF
ncbi:hypothetical protein FT663_03220 [Candidozyma haemuli var. vulneris]|uniref:Small ribosomal subunit protein uS7 domain-containing protein n=1 Tax=Candidozyma haemuli TaxID=45357 RepID=A0A2V1AYU4_9ASCO|nr:hypothetical protein CXQ85_004677 [[Candida] haemuloni]KAF3988715.1 hypothetical protein FT662_03243 [[Candida] haemuloni var. vulneris]KAF3990367.1 hypothetical protein FT663_03220 [[Candida] haemuloni var. vulneris]PVH22011.1 hypothetical protein CXQ85_004677 [[Candida] haemuloni]